MMGRKGKMKMITQVIQYTKNHRIKRGKKRTRQGWPQKTKKKTGQGGYPEQEHIFKNPIPLGCRKERGVNRKLRGDRILAQFFTRERGKKTSEGAKRQTSQSASSWGYWSKTGGQEHQKWEQGQGRPRSTGRVEAIRTS